MFVLLCLVLPAGVRVKAPEGGVLGAVFPKLPGLGSLGHILANTHLRINGYICFHSPQGRVYHRQCHSDVIMTVLALQRLSFTYSKKAGTYIVFLNSDPN